MFAMSDSHLYLAVEEMGFEFIQERNSVDDGEFYTIYYTAEKDGVTVEVKAQTESEYKCEVFERDSVHAPWISVGEWEV